MSSSNEVSEEPTKVVNQSVTPGSMVMPIHQEPEKRQWVLIATIVILILSLLGAGVWVVSNLLERNAYLVKGNEEKNIRITSLTQEIINTKDQAQALSDQLRELGESPVVNIPENLLSGPPGQAGGPGPLGPQGPAGKNATPEQIAAAVAAYCADGKCKGDPGSPGSVGPAGGDGQDGQDGQDGTDGTPGGAGEPGTPGVGITGTQCVQPDPELPDTAIRFTYTDGTTSDILIDCVITPETIPTEGATQ